MIKRPCIRTQIVLRRVSRHPVVRAGSRIQKHVVRSAALGLVPDALNDIAFHHAHVDVNELVHVIQDTTSISLMNLVIATILVSKLGLPSKKDL